MNGTLREMAKPLINADGSSLAPGLPAVAIELAALGDPDRIAFRNANAKHIATHESARILIVAGPGSGKSTLFRQRIKHWLPLFAEDSIYVSSFVRKLVRDLKIEIETDSDLTPEDRKRVTVTTLHGLARSIIERSHGTTRHPLAANVRIIAGKRWLNMMWSDVLEFYEPSDVAGSTASDLEYQFHTEEFETTAEWVSLHSTYFQLSGFFNAVGFADLIVRARQAIDEDPGLVDHLLWIIDEFQDFNEAENHLVRSVTTNAHGVLMAGDDDQALYEQLKASRPEIIVSYYDGPEYANAMLPYCSRCDYFICLGAAAFIAEHRATTAIEKVFLPLKVGGDYTRIQIVATIAPSAAVDYIAKFLADHKTELDAHEDGMRSGKETDPFLLILTPDKELKFYRGRGAPNIQLEKLVSKWAVTEGGHSEDYRKVSIYCSAAWYPLDNFALRQVLDYEGTSAADVHPYIEAALDQGRTLAEVLDPPLSGAVALSNKVAEAVTAEGMDARARVDAVAGLISIENKEVLANELEADPIGAKRNLAEEEADEAIETAGAVAAVELMTMFQSKGLSAQHVIVIGCDDPNLNRTAPLTFFVALTRARRSLHLLTSLQAGGSKGAHPYLADLPEDSCDYVAYKKGTRSIEALHGMRGLSERMEWWSRLTKRSPKEAAAKRRS